MSKLEIDLKAYEGQEIKIKIKDGVAVIESAEKEPEVGKLPEVGYWSNRASNIEKARIKEKASWESIAQRNTYPRKKHAIIVGQLLAPLLVKQWELTGGYWKKKAHYFVSCSRIDNVWYVSSGDGCTIGPLDFPFPSWEMARGFIDENKSQLDEISRLWQEG